MSKYNPDAESHIHQPQKDEEKSLEVMQPPVLPWSCARCTSTLARTSTSSQRIMLGNVDECWFPGLKFHTDCGNRIEKLQVFTQAYENNHSMQIMQTINICIVRTFLKF